MYNILNEPLIRMDKSDGSRVEASLPEVYAALMADKVEAFPALRPHQRHAWHAFLVQLGAMAVHEAGLAEAPRDADEWRRIIRGLTPEWGDDEPWQLVVVDITRPAFMQPPASSKTRQADFKNTVETPDELDMLVTSKNHDVKSTVAVAAAYDDLIFSIISLQTSEGFGGAGNYGISRMNGGLGSRPAFSVAPSTRFGVHIRRDIVVLLERRDDLLADSPMQEEGIGLLWTKDWDGEKAEALLLNALDPLYIEVCRRIRLRGGADGRLRAIRATSKAARINAKALNGVTGDPWTPVDRDGSKSLTLAAGGFSIQAHGRLPGQMGPTAPLRADGRRSAVIGHDATRRPRNGARTGKDRGLPRAHDPNTQETGVGDDAARCRNRRIRPNRQWPHGGRQQGTTHSQPRDSGIPGKGRS